jgi:hypothetical protein
MATEYSEQSTEDQIQQETAKAAVAETAEIATEASKHLDESRFVVSDDNFKTPMMGDYYVGAVDDTYLKVIDQYVRDHKTGEQQKSAFYTETPPITKPGYYPDQGVYCLKAKVNITKKDIELGNMDGDTFSIQVDSVDNGGDQRVTDHINQAISASIKAMAKATGSVSDGSNSKGADFKIRLLAIDAPEIPHWGREYGVDLSLYQTKTIKMGLAKTLQDHLYVKGKVRSDDTDIAFIKLGDAGNWFEYRWASEEDAKGRRNIDWLMSDKSDPQTYEQGMKARDTVVEMLNKANNEVYLMLDATILNRSAQQFPRTYGSAMFDSSFLNTLRRIADSIEDPNDYRYAGFNLLGQDAYRRFLGSCYLQINGEWVNLAKRLIVDFDQIEVNKNFRDMPLYNDHYGMASNAFNLASHEYNDKVWADAVWDASKVFDDRRKVQQQIFGTSFDSLKEWTVVIGDTALFVPPTSIRCVTQTTAERMPLIRAKGTMAKSSEKSERMLELTLFFNDDQGINGYKYETQTPNGKPITYYMNGLRSLIAQFKLTPFLPIENGYVNDVLNVEAVTLVNMQISTVPGFPKLMQATLTLQEFMYRAYMPEIPVQDIHDGEYRNYFAGCINFETMRYYYQRQLRNGQDIAAKGLSFNSKEYIEATLGSKTALLPMKFQKPGIKFYIANEQYLKQMLQTKVEAMRRPDATIILSKAERQAAADLSLIYKKILTMLGDIQFTGPLADLNTTNEGQVLGAIAWVRPYTETSRGDLVDIKLAPIKVGGAQEYTLASERDLKMKLNGVLHRMRIYMDAVNSEAGKTMISSIDLVYKEEDVPNPSTNVKKARITAGISIQVQLDYLGSDDAFKDMKRDASLFIEDSVDKFFVERKLYIPIAVDLEAVYPNNSAIATLYVNSNGKKFYFDGSAPDVKFLGYCNDVATAKEDPNSENIERKQAIDIEKLNSIVFDPYDVGDVRITSMSVAFGNTMAKIGVTSMDGYAPQYIGGQDSEVNIEIQTTDKKAAAMLNALPRLSAFYAREYRLVLPCWPLKLESELTAFLGINEVLVESVMVNTTPNMPGVYSISMRLISVDRTLRNREALKRITANNAGYQGIAARTATNSRSYFELQDVLAQAEIYPDLELPKIEELEKHGFKFIRYKFQDSRAYPDPDFYFVYPHLLTSQILRETVAASIDKNFDDTTWIDKTGATMQTKSAEGKGYSEYKLNEAAQKQKTAVRAANEVRAKQLAKSMVPETGKSKNHDLLNVLNAAETHESWSVCPDIKCIFLEKKYQLELESYKNFKKSQSATIDVDPKATSTKKSPEGQWAFDSMAKALEASEAIDNYLKNTKINEAVQIFHRGPDFDARLNIKQVIKRYLLDDKICNIMYLLNIENTGTFQNIVAEIVYAAACAATGQKEYAGKKFDHSWWPKPDFVGVRLNGPQDKGGKDLTNDVNDAVENAVEFGPFRAKLYTKDELIKITGEDVKDMWIDYPDTINTRRYLIDPYYRRAESEPGDVAAYKMGCIGNTDYAAVAFFRLMLYWLKQLIDTNAIPTISTDILRKAAKNELQIREKQAEYVKDEKDQMSKHMNFFLQNSHALDSGKYFTAAVLALTSGDAKIKDRITKRDYKGLNGYLQGCSMPTNNIDPSDGASLAIRKMMLALVGVGRIKNFSAIGISQTAPATEFMQELNEKKYLRAAEDPKEYIMHSFHDMTVHDARGRMLRAFPTFYMLFIDEGREIGMWKLHDNFYNTSAIAEIQVVKSRKMAADTARIVMSNMYQTYTTEDEDSRTNYEIDYNDVFNSIFSPRVYALKEEAKRTKTPPINRARLRPGARIHIRIGYGSNAATLPIVFNGCIAELQAGESVEIIAQGDGIELMNPILENDEAHEIQFNDTIGGLLTNGATPKKIMNSILTTKGGMLRSMLKDTEYAYMMGKNPYGIFHFGDPDFKDIFKSGEPTQNIYEAMSRPAWGEEGSVTAQYATDDAPRITFDIFGKTLWEIMHICQSVSPDFVVDVAPFGFRSTIFHGSPRYYYAYDYFKKDNIIMEKRKPYQQYHIYSSITDIIKNNITASDKDVKTCAVGLYQMAESGNFKSQHRVGPLWVDIEIFPEEQKTMTVDTQLYGKGIPVVGFLTNSLTNRLANWFADDKGSMTSHDKIAWRMTANALKNSVKDMYQGDLIVLGDPTVKPHDRMFLNDSYENMTGQCLVKEVVQNFSAANGYTTSIYPDAIAVVDDRHELAIQSIGNAMAMCMSAATGGVIWGASMAFGGPAASLVKSIDAIGSKTLSVLNKGAGYAERAGVSGAASKMKGGLNALHKTIMGGRAVAGTVAAEAGLTAGMAGVATAVMLNAAIIGTTIMIGKYITESIARWAQNLQVLQIFPLKRHGLVMTAGLNGNKGLVYGSPSYNDPGLIKGIYAKLTTATDNPYLQFAQDWLMSDEMKNVGWKYKRDGGIVDDKGNPIADERMFNKTLKAAASSRGEITSSYRASQLVPRIALDNKTEVKASFDYYAMLNVERIQADSKLQSNSLISSDQRLKPYLDEKFFQILQEQENLNVSQKVKAMTLMIGNQAVNTKAIIGQTKDGSVLYDMPLLNRDALNVLCEIIKRAKAKMPSADSSDQFQFYEETKGCFIMLKSALKVGDKDTFSSTGFSFILQGFDKAASPLISSIKELQREIAAEAKTNQHLQPEMFRSEVLANNEIAITILLPSVSATQPKEETT